MTEKTVQYYRRLPYQRRVRPEVDSTGDAYFVAWIEEIPWIQADAESREVALQKLNETFADAIEAMIDAGDEIREPTPWPEKYRSQRSTCRRQPEPVVETTQRDVEATPEKEWDRVSPAKMQTAGVP